MAYNILTTTSDVITLTKPIINIPTTTILDNTTLKFAVTVKAASASKTMSEAELLNAIQRIIVTSDGNITNLNVSGYQLALANAFRETKSASPFKRVRDAITAAKVPTGETNAGYITTDTAGTTVKFFLKLNEGDIIAATKKSLTLEVDFAAKVNNDVSIIAATVTPSYSQGVIEDKNADLIGKYGMNQELAAEPKIYVMECDVPANTALTPCLSLQYGALIRRAILTFHSVNAGTVSATPDVVPDRIGLISTNPTRTELINVDAETYADKQNDDYFIDDPANRPAGAFMIDFANTLAADGMGLKGWRIGVDDFRIAVKTSTPCKMKCVFIEHVVNTEAFDKGYMPILESPLGF